MASFTDQYSVPVAFHGTDVTAYFNNPTPPTPNQGPDYVHAIRTIFGNFVTTSNPSISNLITNGPSSNKSSPPNPINSWPTFTIDAPYQMNLNETGGYSAEVLISSGLKVKEDVGPGLENDFSLLNGYIWEGGRGLRCDFWQAMAAIVPE